MQRIKRRSPDIRSCDPDGGVSKQIRVREIGSTRWSKERQYATAKPGRGTARLRRAVNLDPFDQRQQWGRERTVRFEYLNQKSCSCWQSLASVNIRQAG